MRESTVDPNQCLESFENRQWGCKSVSPWPVLVAYITEHTQTRDVLEMSGKHPFGPYEMRKTNTKV